MKEKIWAMGRTFLAVVLALGVFGLFEGIIHKGGEGVHGHNAGGEKVEG